jgi:alpha-beta hydrolase superfamily lysophospholipase
MMVDGLHMDYSTLDCPQVLTRLFHPRPEWATVESATLAPELLIPVAKDVALGARVHATGKAAPTILFFHGNGEIVADYDDLGPVYNRMGINFLPVDYRGYGRSSGQPSVTAMMQDCHVIFSFVKQWLEENGYSGPLIVMGRSLGSASALELAATYPNQIGGLIVESGFAYAGPLLQLLGIDVVALGFKEETGFRNVDKIRIFDRPVLIIHAEHDHIIPFTDGQALYDACRSSDKTLVKIPEANHNNILARGLTPYMAAVKALAERAGAERR